MPIRRITIYEATCSSCDATDKDAQNISTFPPGWKKLTIYSPDLSIQDVNEDCAVVLDFCPRCAEHFSKCELAEIARKQMKDQTT